MALATITAALVKLYLALYTSGSADVVGFSDHLNKIREFGVGVYYLKGPFNNPFNSPPFMIHALRGFGWLADKTNLWFPFWLRLVSILADLGTIGLVWKLLQRSDQRARAPLLIVLLAACPIAIVISGYHGSTDSVMIFLALLSIFVLEDSIHVWPGGAIFGMALNVKVAPLVLAFAIFFYLPETKARIRFFTSAAAVFLVGSLPYILKEPAIIVKQVFGYSSLYGQWGWTSLLVRWYPGAPQFANPPHEVVGIHGAFATVGKWLMLVIIMAVSVWMNRSRSKPPLFLQCGFIIAIFLVLTPGFGSQYVIWLVPWVVVLGLLPTLVFYMGGSLYILTAYACYASGPLSIYCARAAMFYTMLIGWLSIITVLVFYMRSLAHRNAASK